MHVPAPWCPIVIGLSRRDSSAALRPAAPDDSSAVQTAVAAFARLDQVCAAAVAGINAAYFGPFGNDGSCDYDCGFKEQTWWWKADFTTYARTNYLIPSVTQVDCSAGFGNAVAPAAPWRDVQLPAASADFASAIGTIRTIDAAVAAQGGGGADLDFKIAGGQLHRAAGLADEDVGQDGQRMPPLHDASHRLQDSEHFVLCCLQDDHVNLLCISLI